MPASSNSFPEVAIENITQPAPSQGARALGAATLIAPNLYGETLKILDEDGNVDMLLAISDTGRPCTQSIVETGKMIKKPQVVTLFALPEFAAEAYAFLAQTSLP